MPLRTLGCKLELDQGTFVRRLTNANLGTFGVVSACLQFKAVALLIHGVKQVVLDSGGWKPTHSYSDVQHSGHWRFQARRPQGDLGPSATFTLQFPDLPHPLRRSEEQLLAAPNAKGVPARLALLLVQGCGGGGKEGVRPELVVSTSEKIGSVKQHAPKAAASAYPMNTLDAPSHAITTSYNSITLFLRGKREPHSSYVLKYSTNKDTTTFGAMGVCSSIGPRASVLDDAVSASGWESPVDAHGGISLSQAHDHPPQATVPQDDIGPRQVGELENAVERALHKQLCGDTLAKQLLPAVMEEGVASRIERSIERLYDDSVADLNSSFLRHTGCLVSGGNREEDVFRISNSLCVKREISRALSSDSEGALSMLRENWEAFTPCGPPSYTVWSPASIVSGRYSKPQEFRRSFQQSPTGAQAAKYAVLSYLPHAKVGRGLFIKKTSGHPLIRCNSSSYDSMAFWCVAAEACPASKGLGGTRAIHDAYNRQQRAPLTERKAVAKDRRGKEAHKGSRKGGRRRAEMILALEEHEVAKIIQTFLALLAPEVIHTTCRDFPKYPRQTKVFTRDTSGATMSSFSNCLRFGGHIRIGELHRSSGGTADSFKGRRKDRWIRRCSPTAHAAFEKYSRTLLLCLGYKFAVRRAVVPPSPRLAVERRDYQETLLCHAAADICFGNSPGAWFSIVVSLVGSVECN
ncbi:hypothetical protein cyc_02936 [Cyclospora cayetanensis]|uniref:Uncharacterized protein n=1 Tax=Cyclospora cayetanensis TaxID=88456 RepID=A0A1D3D7P2_9EIME|nr:hypothetical protein cyc_02936 [Cyclospora cayetanensis]